MKAIIFFFLIALFTVPTVTGQIKIGDNPQNIDPASILELESSSKVLVITRVTTAEMDAILPQRGGIVYNTDAECIYYYDGVAWINLCDAVDFNITNDPIINNRSTIAITQSNAGYNLEVAKNSILGNNIVDGGIGAVDIADNSITQDKLAENSVGSSEIRENAVGSVELKERSIQAVNIAEHTPGHILITDENGIVVWQEADALKGAIADEFTITGDGTLENRLELSEGIQLNISNNTTLIADHIVADEDTDDTNELVDLSFDKLTNTLSISKSATPNGGSVNLEAVIGSDDQELTLNNNILTLEAGGAPIDLTTYLDNTDEQTLSINGNVLSITGGNDITLPAGAAEVDGDVRNELQDLAFDNATNILTLTTPGTPGNQVNLSGLAGGGITSLNNGFILVGNATNEPTEVSIDGDATMNNIGELTIKDGVITPANIEPLTPTPTVNQMLITNTAGVVTWVPAGSGTSALDNGHIFIGNDLNTATPTVVQGDASLSNNGTLTLLNKVVEGANIADETIVLENLNQNGATNGQIIKWDQSLNAGAGAWTVTNDLTDGTGIPTLASGTMLIGSNTNLPTEVTISGDATIANSGILTIADDAISLNNLSDMGAEDGEVLKWNETTLAWEPAADNTGTAGDDNQNIEGSVLTGEVLTIGIEGGNNQDVSLATFALDSEVATAITASETADGDRSATNEIQNITSTNGTVTVARTNNDFDLSVTGGTDDQNIEGSVLTGEVLTIGIEGGNNQDVSLATFALDSEVATAITASETADGDRSATNEIQNITSTNGTVTVARTNNDFDLSVTGGTDDQNIEGSVLTGEVLTIGIEGGNNQDVSLATFALDSEVATAITASETADGDRSATNEIQNITSTNGTVTVARTNNDFDLSVTGGTDDQNIEGSVLTGEVLTIGIEGGNNQDVSLATFALDSEVATAITASETADGDRSATNEIQNITSTNGTVTVARTNNDFDLAVTGGTDDQNIVGSVLTGEVLTIGIEGGNNQDVSLAAFALDSEVATAITASETADGDRSATNEIQNITSTNGTVTIARTNNDFDLSVTSGQNIANANLNLNADRTLGLAGNNLSFSGTGNIRIGNSTTVNANKLHVEGTIRAEGIRNTFGTLPSSVAYSFNDDSNTGMYRAAADQLGLVTGGTEAIRIDTDQNVGIGTATPNGKLHVVGTSRFDGDVFVNGTQVPDYVFQKYFLGDSNLKPDYDMPSLLEVENFIKANHHLPNVPSYHDIEKQGGIIINKTTLTNLEKIEELFLHTIEQEKKIKALETTNKDMANEIELLKAQMEEIKHLMLVKTKE
ncbi:hypothetical protein [Maribacter sp. MAR_2009_72]|uniref:hypothetical protein n=1 Tax=Maribacter sp. MAR_2009_72 TaxID=1250050 RepID=UPI00119B88F0|nr:hypothetical protein [Maribacter sp. MAR_2009_72]TVZ15216.1 hypothetical protein JM81_1441 [Maribacter sp. MAR_2009_72]